MRDSRAVSRTALWSARTRCACRTRSDKCWCRTRTLSRSRHARIAPRLGNISSSAFLAGALRWSWGFRRSSGCNGKGQVLAKEVKTLVKLQIPAGKANPAPPVGPALGQHGVNIMEFCKQFNAKTQSQEGSIIPVIITVYTDRSFTFVMKTPPASDLLKKAAGIIKGSGVPNKDKVGQVTPAQINEIARIKMPDLNAADVTAAARIIEGTARSMGIVVAKE